MLLFSLIAFLAMSIGYQAEGILNYTVEFKMPSAWHFKLHSGISSVITFATQAYTPWGYGFQ